MMLNENEFECPNCGETVTTDFARCPSCGISFYDPPDEPDEESGPRVPPGAGLLAGLLAGWLASGMGAFVLHLLTLQIVRAPALPPYGRLLLFLAGPLGGFIGGYIAASIARQRPLIVGLAAGVLAAANAALLLSVWVPFNLDLLLDPASLVEWALTLAAGAAGAYVYAKTAERAALQKLFRPPASEDELYQDLLRKVRYDRAAVRRLLEYERSRNPDAPRRELLSGAIRRWERDNR